VIDALGQRFRLHALDRLAVRSGQRQLAVLNDEIAESRSRPDRSRWMAEPLCKPPAPEEEDRHG
jgi:hypothetical protein